ncbi:PLU-1-domain-containing protein [Eremomyces bilateralis CBS 781.70]|uniref:PLU-1-domain-containing protein n=1 Tax=Eremomyces bilateralis CBS 781.70 TaxID=1392243 RepID=A0A6G1G325_9PEZI|nr:PLU-1-domain-containing protein [Eremomyces bilateralis CBS 781.70]KAF1812331.1 PLU-1-domain-containing protein [Eremomyces bilateralis CBS 781.70]
MVIPPSTGGASNASASLAPAVSSFRAVNAPQPAVAHDPNPVVEGWRTMSPANGFTSIQAQAAAAGATPNGISTPTGSVQGSSQKQHVNGSANAPSSAGQRTRVGNLIPVNPQAPPNSTGGGFPLSSRKALPLDLATVERRLPPQDGLPPGSNGRAMPEPIKMSRHFGLDEAPTYRPTEEEFAKPFDFIRSIAEEGRRYGIVKIIPPDTWNPPFTIDTEKFHFRTRRQELNEVEGSNRENVTYLEALAKFHKQNSNTNLNRFPSVDKRPLDLYRLKRLVEEKGGFDTVCKGKRWAEIGRDLGYSGKIMSSLSTSLKNSYQKWLQPFEEYIRLNKHTVRYQQELDNGGPYTPSPGPSPVKQSPPTAITGMSPAARASQALHATLQNGAPPAFEPQPQEVSHETPPRPFPSSGFTAVNSGFTAVNAPQHSPPAPAPTQQSLTGSFPAINFPNGITNGGDTGRSTPMTTGSPMGSAKGTPDLRDAYGVGHIPNGHLNPLKRTDSELSNEDPSGRRSKRVKRENAPTVVGSFMSQPKQPIKTPGLRDRVITPGEACEICGKMDTPLHGCDGCDSVYHEGCLDEKNRPASDGEWHCPKCLVGTGEYGFQDGYIYSLKQFQEKARLFKENHFASKMVFDPIANKKRDVPEDEVEREFWRLAESLTESVEVEYGADIHSGIHGSGFPTIEKFPDERYSRDPWNLNNMPLDKESLFRHIKSDISGMTVPWVYVGMCFSCFCWHAEDHNSYSINYQHFGDTKTWYGIPADSFEAFERATKELAPDLTEKQPDLLYQLVTLFTPDKLRKYGVNVYAADQRAGQFIVTFPQAYHAGFNHGFNLNEAVNFAPSDWEPYGETGVLRLRDFRRPPCFSHDELLVTAAARDHSIKTARWLGPALERMLERELLAREDFKTRHMAAMKERWEDRRLELGLYSDPQPGVNRPLELLGGPPEGLELLDHVCKLFDKDHVPVTTSSCSLLFAKEDPTVSEEDYVCSYCNSYSFLSRFYCATAKKSFCLIHAGTVECCGETNWLFTSRSLYDSEIPAHGTEIGHHIAFFRHQDDALKEIVQKVVDVAITPNNWEKKLEKVCHETATPQLRTLRSLLAEGEKINAQWPIGEELTHLKRFVERCNEWVDEATGYVTRKQQNRRKNEKVWRRSTIGSRNKYDDDDRDKEYRNVDHLTTLLSRAAELGFDCSEIGQLQERKERIEEFQDNARKALADPRSQDVKDLDDLLEVGRSFGLDIPEMERLDRLVQQIKWWNRAQDLTNNIENLTLEDLAEFLNKATEVGIPEADPVLYYIKELKNQGEFWENKAKELMSVENVHYQQLDALSKQAAQLPVSKTTLAKVDAILKKQRDAQDQIQNLLDRSKNPDFRQRPKYTEVRDAMEAVNQLNSKPAGTIDLEKEQRRHEDWMRRGKKLFGKANAPLHILLQHMKYVDERNKACFDLSDQPRMPVEPSSREHTPNEDQPQSQRDVFCICRKPEAGMMVECELCHEWYHGRCLKIARGKLREDDKYTCPICDHRVTIPRDAARPKLEDCVDWQVEIPGLPFQPEEEECLASIRDTATAFRNFMQSFMNPMLSNPDELTTQRFYLRKLEGADILLSAEINFFRQELHKWAPVAPDPPRMIAASLSTRKPRPTKQQKLMQQYGVSTPDDLPAHIRIRGSGRGRKASDAHSVTRPQSAGSSHASAPPFGGTPIPGAAAGAGRGRGGHYQSEGRPHSNSMSASGDHAMQSPSVTYHHHHHHRPSLGLVGHPDGADGPAGMPSDGLGPAHAHQPPRDQSPPLFFSASSETHPRDPSVAMSMPLPPTTLSHVDDIVMNDGPYFSGHYAMGGPSTGGRGVGAEEAVDPMIDPGLMEGQGPEGEGGNEDSFVSGGSGDMFKEMMNMEEDGDGEKERG